MTKTEKIVDFYTDIFGNEINVYEEIPRYTVGYEGYLFYGDTDGWNEHNIDLWEDAIAIYYAYGDMIYIRDNEYGVTFSHGNWN